MAESKKTLWALVLVVRVVSPSPLKSTGTTRIGARPTDGKVLIPWLARSSPKMEEVTGVGEEEDEDGEEDEEEEEDAAGSEEEESEADEESTPPFWEQATKESMTRGRTTAFLMLSMFVSFHKSKDKIAISF